MSTSPDATESAKQAQADAESMGMNEDDEREGREQAEQTGEPQRDALGNEDGAS
jgi:hypothetical protein